MYDVQGTVTQQVPVIPQKAVFQRFYVVYPWPAGPCMCVQPVPVAVTIDIDLEDIEKQHHVLKCYEQYERM